MDLVLQIITKCGQRGRGSKIPKTSWMYFMYGPLEVRGAPAGHRVLQYLVRLVAKRLKHGPVGIRW